MFRYTLTMPVNENDGSSLTFLHEGIARRLARDFDGFTAAHASGGWYRPDAQNPGREDVIVYTVDTDRPDAAGILTTLAAILRRAAAQDGVYLTRQPIETVLVTAGPFETFA